MTADEKLAAILAAVQTDPGNRGNSALFRACPDDFAAACRSIADHREPAVDVFTGSFAPTAIPPGLETDGPLGAVFLARALIPLGVHVTISTEKAGRNALARGLRAGGLPAHKLTAWDPDTDPGGNRPDRMIAAAPLTTGQARVRSHYVALERVGPGIDGRCRTMRGLDVTDDTAPVEMLFPQSGSGRVRTIGIGDSGNEIGMGKIPHDVVAANVLDGDRIHCRVPTDFLIVAGVSNWGAYALAAGVSVLRGATPPAGLFDPAREREILEVMVREGPLVDGVTGKQTATVDGLTWDEYAGPLARIGAILRG
ncbi:MAG: glutamate cyclase domain-containing protein [Fimbriiglobus sp.]